VPTPTELSTPLWPLGVYFAAVLVLVASMLGLSSLLGQRRQDRDTDAPYEAGVAPTGSARRRFAAPFYLVALFFVIFDLEVVFLFAWAIAARALGWSGYLGMLLFMGVLAVALLYEWCLGVLDGWGRAPVKLGALCRRSGGERPQPRRAYNIGRRDA
jgi:NADH-quinone oxidoreductase subunit A